MRTARPCLVLACALIASATVAAHDFWLSSTQWSASPGTKLTILANVGDRFPKPTSLTAADRVESLKLLGPGEARDISGFRQEGRSLAADVTLPATAATYIALMVIKPRVIEIKPSDFHSYLRHEGLDAVIGERDRRGEADKPGRELYARYGKLLIRAGDGLASHVITPLGLPAELVPAVDLTTLRPGGSLDVRLLANGRPVPGALIGAVYASSTGKPDEWPVRARTDPQGRATLILNAPGPWLIRSVHMVRNDDSRADWASHWASLAFDFGK